MLNVFDWNCWKSSKISEINKKLGISKLIKLYQEFQLLKIQDSLEVMVVLAIKY